MRLPEARFAENRLDSSRHHVDWENNLELRFWQEVRKIVVAEIAFRPLRWLFKSFHTAHQGGSDSAEGERLANVAEAKPRDDRFDLLEEAKGKVRLGRHGLILHASFQEADCVPSSPTEELARVACGAVGFTAD